MEDKVAVIELGGKQHLVKEGSKLVVNSLDSKEGDILELPNLLAGNTIKAKVIAHQLGKKVSGLKFKAKTRYLRRYGHRQHQTIVEVLGVNETKKPTAAATKPAKKAPAKTKAAAKTKTVKKVKNG